MGGGFECGPEGSPDRAWGAETQDELEGKVHFHGEPEGPVEAPEGVDFAVLRDAHVHDLAWDGAGLGWITPFRRQAHVPSGISDQVVGLVFLAVGPFATSGAAEGVDDAEVDRGGGANPFVVGLEEAFGGVEPGPHYH